MIAAPVDAMSIPASFEDSPRFSAARWSSWRRYSTTAAARIKAAAAEYQKLYGGTDTAKAAAKLLEALASASAKPRDMPGRKTVAAEEEEENEPGNEEGEQGTEPEEPE